MILICHPRNLLLCSVQQTSSRWSRLTPFSRDCDGEMACLGVSKGIKVDVCRFFTTRCSVVTSDTCPMF